ncbi:MAG: restriction endonuclease subunit S [Oscillospiraceae bacterium]|nr:restriction endonuclease subunit S [Oscillospiraceae bacterium]
MGDKLDISTWKLFKMSDIFIFTKGKRLTKEDMIPGKLNYLGAISDNNAVRDYIDADVQHEGNCITVNYNGSVGESFYQSEPFWATDDINILDLKEKLMTENIGLFLCSVIKHNKYKFGYGRKWTLEKMKETKILLPTINNDVDYNYMDSYIKMLNIKHVKTVNTKKTASLTSWQLFKIGDIFDVSIGKSEDLSVLEHGKINFVGRTSLNNSIQSFVDTDTINKGNCITLGMVGTYYPAWQENDFSCSQNILILRNLNLNKYIALFINTLIKKMVNNKYSYNRPIQKNKFVNEIISLPYKNNTIDWLYMENYIKALPYADKM